VQDILSRELVHDQGSDTLHSRLVMSTNIRSAILERNQELRRNPGALQDLSFGRLALSIPELDYWHLRKKYPDMFEGDAETRQRALARFCASPESAPYKVR